MADFYAHHTTMVAFGQGNRSFILLLQWCANVDEFHTLCLNAHLRLYVLGQGNKTFNSLLRFAAWVRFKLPIALVWSHGQVNIIWISSSLGACSPIQYTLLLRFIWVCLLLDIAIDLSPFLFGVCSTNLVQFHPYNTTNVHPWTWLGVFRFLVWDLHYQHGRRSCPYTTMVHT